MKKASYSNIAVALIFFVAGVGIGGTIGMYHGYGLGYRHATSDKLIKPDTIIIHEGINTLENSEYE